MAALGEGAGHGGDDQVLAVNQRAIHVEDHETVDGRTCDGFCSAVSKDFMRVNSSFIHVINQYITRIPTRGDPAHSSSAKGSSRASCGRQPIRSQVRAICSGSGAVKLSIAPVIGCGISNERACRCSLRLTSPPSCAPQPLPRFSCALVPYFPSPM